jgi:hypothetical protein
MLSSVCQCTALLAVSCCYAKVGCGSGFAPRSQLRGFGIAADNSANDSGAIEEGEVDYPMSLFVQGLAIGSKDTRVSTGIVNSAGVLGRGSEAEGFALREQARGPPFVVALILSPYYLKVSTSLGRKRDMHLLQSSLCCPLWRYPTCSFNVKKCVQACHSIDAYCLKTARESLAYPFDGGGGIRNHCWRAVQSHCGKLTSAARSF